MPTHHLTMNTIDLGYVIPGAYSGLSWIRGCSSLCCTDQASVGALETNEPSVAPTKLRLVHFLLWQAAKPSATNCPNAFFPRGPTGPRVKRLLISTVLRFCLLPVCHPYVLKDVNRTSGGYRGGVPPLPIPNREVKPACADGTAMQCGRVGSRLL